MKRMFLALLVLLCSSCAHIQTNEEKAQALVENNLLNTVDGAINVMMNEASGELGQVILLEYSGHVYSVDGRAAIVTVKVTVGNAKVGALNFVLVRKGIEWEIVGIAKAFDMEAGATASEQKDKDMSL